MARGKPENDERGASGDTRDKTSNVGGTKHFDRGRGEVTTGPTGSPAGDKLVDKRAKESEKRD